MERRTTIRLNDETVSILDSAKEIWPEHAESQSAIIRAVVSDWWRNREQNGGKTRKILEHIDGAKDEIIAEIRKACG